MVGGLLPEIAAELGLKTGTALQVAAILLSPIGACCVAWNTHIMGQWLGLNRNRQKDH